MEEFLKTKRGLEYLLETSSPSMPIQTAIKKAVNDYLDTENDELMRQAGMDS